MVDLRPGGFRREAGGLSPGHGESLKMGQMAYHPLPFGPSKLDMSYDLGYIVKYLTRIPFAIWHIYIYM